MTRRRIAFAGFQHETNTFAPSHAGLAEFEVADSWPGLLQGQKVVDGSRGMNLPIAGAVRAAEEAGNVEVIPILWCAAEPSGPVTDEAFDQISGTILAGLKAAGPLDAVYLDLHGAMVTDSYDDGEAELLSRIRKMTGPDMVIGVSLDFHANLSHQLVDLATVITINRTNPHLDMGETGARCLVEVLRTLDGCSRTVAFQQAPFLVPLHALNTGAEPCKSLYQAVADIPASSTEYIELAMGFTAADVPDCGPSVVAYAETRNRAEEMLQALFQQLIESEAAFDTSLLSADEAVRSAMSMTGSGPVVLADVQDNPGAGASSDTTGLLRALAGAGAHKAILGIMCDAEICAKAHEFGVGGDFHGGLGGRSGIVGDQPFKGHFKVRALSDGRIPYTGEMYAGSIAEIGPSCLLAIENEGREILVVVSSERTQCLDRALFTHFGVDPYECEIVCVKSIIHFRADFEPGSLAVLNVSAPGLFPCELKGQNYQKLRRGLRILPIS
ncbi:M81 family metallopeptidase [Shimia sp. CNT1-13L.2]|uniref:M81 family metallopeptidase n=1 Tax=Shimia sp. CNT1-13L.2 TaxID=2959663 RepID=UPI0020CE5502|nr:M81 family metallopeptidase [Shimia sp. CNT1-13L.2]MCP9483299.1 M81 family metallopeptidase [Shimia sp. CNT1-13L.2]